MLFKVTDNSVQKFETEIEYYNYGEKISIAWFEVFQKGCAGSSYLGAWPIPVTPQWTRLPLGKLGDLQERLILRPAAVLAFWRELFKNFAWGARSIVLRDSYFSRSTNGLKWTDNYSRVFTKIRALYGQKTRNKVRLQRLPSRRSYLQGNANRVA